MPCAASSIDLDDPPPFPTRRSSDLGTVLYEAASTYRLFDGKRPADKMKAVLSVKPRPLNEIVPNFPVPLWRVIEQALAKDPAARWPDRKSTGLNSSHRVSSYAVCCIIHRPR